MGCFHIERLPGVSHKNRRYAKCIVNYECRGSRIPCSISPCLESVPQPSVGKAGSVRLLLYQRFSLEIFKNTSVFGRIHKSFVFFGCGICQRMKPVSIMSSSPFYGPCFHSGSNLVCNLPVNFNTLVYCHLDCIESFR
ncbi:hypothetical protein SDC9_116702 [bioreactor metagenome]|uniref:Uncharacterized protein n=1 Tax=bioreactor metagenome TaxID=1076179 RepID=A0A645C728_9ZZZZ